MPTYQYACVACGHQLEAVQAFTDEPLTTCPECGSPLRKVFSAVGIVFKGSGFYRTDSRSGNTASTPAGAGSEKAGAEKSGSDKGGSDKGSPDKGGSGKGGSGKGGSDKPKSDSSSGGSGSSSSSTDKSSTSSSKSSSSSSSKVA